MVVGANSAAVADAINDDLVKNDQGRRSGRRFAIDMASEDNAQAISSTTSCYSSFIFGFPAGSKPFTVAVVVAIVSALVLVVAAAVAASFAPTAVSELDVPKRYSSPSYSGDTRTSTLSSSSLVLPSRTNREAGFPLVARVTFPGGPDEADDALRGTDLDAMGRGKRTGRTQDKGDGGGIVKKFLLHDEQDLAALEAALIKTRTSVDGEYAGEGGSGGGFWEVDREGTDLLRTVVDAAAVAASSSSFASKIRGADERARGEKKDVDVARDLLAYQTIPGFDCYRTVDGTTKAVYAIAARYPNVATTTVIGHSVEGRELLVLKLTDSRSTSSGGAKKKSPMFITSGLHAREYAPVEVVTRLAEYIARVHETGTNADVDWIMSHVELSILFVANPDGRIRAELTVGSDRYWRKNARVTGCDKPGPWGQTSGVDLNRNFDFKWGASSTDPCSQSFRGTKAASEPETRSAMSYSQSIFPRDQRKSDPVGSVDDPYDEATSTGLYVDVHSSGEDVIFPWGHKSTKVGNFEAYRAMAHKLCSFNGYEPSGSGYNFLGAVAGDTLDFHYGQLGVASILFEIGTDFHDTCDTFLRTILPSNTKALLYSAKLARSPYTIAKGPDIMKLIVPSKVSAGSTPTVSIVVHASDRARTVVTGFPSVPSGGQGVSKIELYVGGHPYDSAPPQPISAVPSPPTDGHTAVVTFSLNVSKIGRGRHMVCVVATDGDGYEGPVSCEYMLVEMTAGSGGSNFRSYMAESERDVSNPPEISISITKAVTTTTTTTTKTS